MWERWLLVSLVVMCVTNTITQEQLFDPLRRRLGGKDTWLGYLCCCPYCLSHSLAFLLVPLFGLKVLTIPHDWGFATAALEWFFNSILVVVLAAFIRMFFYSIDDLVGVLRVRQEKETAEKRHVEQKIEQAENGQGFAAAG